ncbi:hypothetical protein M0R36_04080 [bacterium]|jgi:hypothetical protein|nr:hypothetical protein [bacterium]
MIFEAIMLLCFGAAWPVSIWKSYKSKRNEGKSPFFLYIILLGYVSGAIYKIFYNYDVIIALFILNILMVSVDIGIYHRNKRLAESA